MDVRYGTSPDAGLMRLEELSKTEFRKALQRTNQVLTRGKMISDQPEAILLCGQSEAGMTAIH